MADPLFDPFPKYLQIREIIMRRLQSFDVGDRLPTEHEFADEFNVSRETVRQALRSLEEEKMILRRPRLGTFLAKPPPISADLRLTGPIEEFANLGVTTETHVAGQGLLSATPEVAAALKLKPGETAYEISRVRLLDGRPLLLMEAFFPADIGEKVGRQDLRGSLIVPVLRSIWDEQIREEYQQIDAVTAGKRMAALLKIRESAPVLLVKRLFVDRRGRPVVLFKSNFRSDRYYYTVKLPQSRQRRTVKAKPRTPDRRRIGKHRSVK